MIGLLAVSQSSIICNGWGGLSTVDQMRACVDAGIGGIGLIEAALPDESPASLQRYIETGLRVTLAVPRSLSLSSRSLDTVVADGQRSVRRFTAFDPVAVSFRLVDLEALTAQAVRSLARVSATVHPRATSIGLYLSNADRLQQTELADFARRVGEPNLCWVATATQVYAMRPSLDREFASALCCLLVTVPPEVVAGHGDTSTFDLLVDTIGRLREAGYRGWFELELPVHALELAGAGADRAGLGDVLRHVKEWFRAADQKATPPPPAHE